MKRVLGFLLLTSALALSVSLYGQGSRSGVRLYVSLDDGKYTNMTDQTVRPRVTGDSEGLLEIATGSPFSRQFYSGNRIDVPMLMDYWENNEVILPKLNVYVVNNSRKTLNLSSLELAVSDSELDRRPYFNIATYLGENSHEMSVVSLGYSNEPYLELSYRILKKGESFNGSYDRKRVLPSKGGTIDFLDDLVAMGYDYNAMKRANPQVREERVTRDGKSAVSRSVKVGSLSETQMERLFKPFIVKKEMVGSGRYAEAYYKVLAPIYGELRCPGSGKTYRFKGELCLGDSGELGAEMDEDGSYDVRLEETGRDYRIRYPYHATVEPGGSVKVGLTLYCRKSSYHHFKVGVKDENGQTVLSRNVSLQYFFPQGSWPKQGYVDDY